jgi:hypothetical protein
MFFGAISIGSTPILLVAPPPMEVASLKQFQRLDFQVVSKADAVGRNSNGNHRIADGNNAALLNLQINADAEVSLLIQKAQ